MPKEPPATPDSTNLYQAALTYLARYAATEAGLRRVLLRRIDRWARQQPDAEAAEPVVLAARSEVATVLKRLSALGALNDAEYAASRARGLVRGGQSSRAVQTKLIAKGVAPELARSAAETDTETAHAAALVLARKRRIGPFRATGDAGEAGRMKELGILARAGFPRDICETVLNTERPDAEAKIFGLRQ
jgi:regulatory protein